jgi:hypothetical protein
MKNLDLEETVQKTIRAAVRADLQERKPSDFHGLYFSTLTNVTASFGWYDKYRLRSLVSSEIMASFPKLVTEADKRKLVAICFKAVKQINESNWEREAFNLGVEYN